METSKLNVAIYCRISKDDGSINESQSIQSQKEILTDYVNNHKWNLFDYYIDDGYSGTDFNRPSFNRLLTDIEDNKINIVITKDLSRLGRNYIQTGYYTEEYFPNHNVRYIALNDNFDTNDDFNDFIPFKNIINEWYAKDISKKIRFTLDNKAKNGEPRNTVFPIFGYAYNEKYERIPDPETAPIVKLIFEQYLKLGSSTKVVKVLKDKKIKIPSYYNAIRYGYNKKKVLAYSEEKLITWKLDVIRDILTRNDYLGTYTTARSKSLNYKVKKRLNNENPYVFENRYEALIDKDTWEKVNKMLKRTRAGKVALDDNVYKGLVICSDCNNPMKYDRKKSNSTLNYNFYRYYCAKKNCSYVNSIQIKYLNEIIKHELLNLKDVILSHKDEFTKFINVYNQKGRNVKTDYERKINIYNNKSKEIDKYIMKLFEHNTKGYIPKSTFEMMMSNYNKEKKYIDEQLKELTKNDTNEKCNDNKTNELLNMFVSINENNILSIDIIHSIINHINISSRKIDKHKRKYIYDISISFRALDDIIKEY